MKVINTRDLRDYYPPTQARSRISLLDRLTGVSYNKLVWFKDCNGAESGSNLRHIDLNKGIEALQAYLVAHQHNAHHAVKKSLSVKRRLLNVLLILKDK